MTAHPAKKNTPGRISGVVVSTKMKDTVVVEITRFVKVPKYGKYIRRSKRYKAHDPGNTATLGAPVTIVPCRPISKEKHFRILPDTNPQMNTNYTNGEKAK